jgi:hypothetical protein
MGARCSKLLISDNPCDIAQCVTQKKFLPHLSNSLDRFVWRLVLKDKTQFQTQTLDTVLYTIFFNNTLQETVSKWASFLHYVHKRGICPFLQTVYSVGYQCQLDANSLSLFQEAFQSPRLVKDMMVTIQNEPAVLSWEDWAGDSNTKDLDKKMIAFQCAYTCHVCNLAGFDFGFQGYNLNIKKLSAPTVLTFFISVNQPVFFKMLTSYCLDVSGLLHIDTPETVLTNYDWILALYRDAFSGQFVRQLNILDTEAVLKAIAAEVDIVVTQTLPSVFDTLIGVDANYFKNGNVVPFSLNVPNIEPFFEKYEALLKEKEELDQIFKKKHLNNK